jgi:hypothetical protein
VIANQELEGETKELKQMHPDERATLMVELAVVAKSMCSLMARLDSLRNYSRGKLGVIINSWELGC